MKKELNMFPNLYFNTNVETTEKFGYVLCNQPREREVCCLISRSGPLLVKKHIPTTTQTNDISKDLYNFFPVLT